MILNLNDGWWSGKTRKEYSQTIDGRRSYVCYGYVIVLINFLPMMEGSMTTFHRVDKNWEDADAIVVVVWERFAGDPTIFKCNNNNLNKWNIIFF